MALLRRIIESAAYPAVFYVSLIVGTSLVLDFASAFLLALVMSGVYYAARNRKAVVAHFGSLLSMHKYRKANQNPAIKRLTDNLLFIYIILLTARLYMNGLAVLPDQMIFYALVGAMLVGRGRRFVEDWAPLFVLFFAYEAMRGIADNLGAAVHYIEPIEWERMIFGFLPCEALQQAFYTPGTVNWYDIAAMTLYALHLAVPLIFAFGIWVKDRERFIRYSGALLLVTYMGLATFMLWPMAPPWLAAEHGLISVRKVLFESSDVMNFTVYPTIYTLINSNPVAAMPSLHAAYPILMAVFAARIWKFKGALLMSAYAVAMWLSLVYLGEHYAVDLLAGAAYAMAGLLVADLVSERLSHKG